jgi:hypothetical protein
MWSVGATARAEVVDQTFQPDFSEFLFILIALNVTEIPEDSHPNHLELGLIFYGKRANGSLYNILPK